MTTKIIFNGDTAAGRAQWEPWLRSLELELDEWVWAVLQAEVPSQYRYKDWNPDADKRDVSSQD